MCIQGNPKLSGGPGQLETEIEVRRLGAAESKKVLLLLVIYLSGNAWVLSGKILSGHSLSLTQDDVIKWKYFPRYWPFVRGINRSPVNSLHKGQWRRALMFSFICVWINGWVNSREADDLKRHRAHNDVTVMLSVCLLSVHLSRGIHINTFIYTLIHLPNLSPIWLKFHLSLYIYIYIYIYIYMIVSCLNICECTFYLWMYFSDNCVNS